MAETPASDGGSGFTYFIQMGDGGPIKIGHSDNPWGRLKGLQTSAPEPLRLLLVLKGARKEKDLHQLFSAYRLEGEWFSPSKEILDYVDANYRSDVEPPRKRLNAVRTPQVSAADGSKIPRHWDFSGKTFEATLKELQATERLLAAIGGCEPKDMSDLARQLCGKGPELVTPTTSVVT